MTEVPIDHQRLEIASQRLVAAATDIKREIGIGEPEFTTALARALLYRVAVVAKPGDEVIMLDAIISYLWSSLPLARDEVAKARRETREKLASKLRVVQ